MAVPILHVGAKFSNWDDVFRTVEEYSKATNQPFIRYSSKLCSTVNRNLTPGQPRYPEHMKYAYRTFRCCHGGVFSAKGSGLRKTSSQKIGCDAKIHVAVNRFRTDLEVIKMNENHCHSLDLPISEVRKKKKFLPETSAMEGNPMLIQRDLPPQLHDVINSTSPEHQVLPNLSSGSCSCKCDSHSPCPNIASFLSFFQRKDDEDRKLREQDIDLRRRECILREKEMELQRQRFEFDKQERKALMGLLRGQLKAMEQLQRSHDMQQNITTNYNVAMNNSMDIDNHIAGK